MPTLDSILMEIKSMLDVPDEDLNTVQRADMEAYFAALGQAQADKVDAIVQFLKIESAHTVALKEEAKRLTAKAKAAESRLDRLKQHYTESMLLAGFKKLQGSSYSMALRETTSVKVDCNVDTLPPEYVREKVSREVDKLTIRDHLKAGVVIPGCKLEKVVSLQVR